MNKDTVTGDLESRFLGLPDPDEGMDWNRFEELSYVGDYGVTLDDVPELLEFVKKWLSEDKLEEWIEATGHDHYWCFPIHAWRALAELHADEAVEPLLSIMNELGEEDDDWILDDFPSVFACLGDAAVTGLMKQAADDSNQVSIRNTALVSLVQICAPETENCRPETKREIEQYLVDAMQQAADFPKSVDESKTPAEDLDFIRYNSVLLDLILDMGLVAAAPAIEKAFSENQIDVSMCGDWEDVRKQLNVESLGLTMPEQPICSINRDRLAPRSGLFFNRRIFDSFGEYDEETANEYCENAMEAFSKSQEFREVEEKYDSTRWVYNFLEMGVRQLGETVDSMTVSDAEEIVFEIFPSKISVEAAEADAIVFALRKFWEFLHREHQLSNAPAIIQLFGPEATTRLRRELSNPSNFGMAKSFVMMGYEAGFDMTTQEGLDGFMAFYNASLTLSTRKSRDTVDYSPQAIPPSNSMREPEQVTRHMSKEELQDFKKNRQKLLNQKRKR